MNFEFKPRVFNFTLEELIEGYVHTVIPYNTNYPTTYFFYFDGEVFDHNYCTYDPKEVPKLGRVRISTELPTHIQQMLADHEFVTDQVDRYKILDNLLDSDNLAPDDFVRRAISRSKKIGAKRIRNHDEFYVAWFRIKEATIAISRHGVSLKYPYWDANYSHEESELLKAYLTGRL